MEPFETVLQAGGHTNSLGRSHEVFEAVKQDPHKLEELFACISAEDAWVRMRAIDTFEKIIRETPGLARPYTHTLITDLTKSSQPSIQWHLAQLFAEITLDQPQTASVLAWLKDRIATTSIDWIVSVNVMKALLYFKGKGAIDSASLRELFKVQTEHSSKSVRKKANLFLESL